MEGSIGDGAGNQCGGWISIGGGLEIQVSNGWMGPRVTISPYRQKYRLVCTWSNGDTTELVIRYKAADRGGPVELGFSSKKAQVTANTEKYPHVIVHLHGKDKVYEINLLMPVCDANRLCGMVADKTIQQDANEPIITCLSRMWQIRGWTTPHSLADV